MDKNTITIRELNDNFRESMTGGRVVVTVGVTSKGDDLVQEVFGIVRKYENFSVDNDPYGEHEFGDFLHNGEKYFWKIDYYNLDHSGLSENPADPEITNRVLTIFLASEY